MTAFSAIGLPAWPGRDEIDLIPIELVRPNDPNNNSPQVTLSITGSMAGAGDAGGAVALWEKATKETKVNPMADGTYTIGFGPEQPRRTLYLETRYASQGLGDYRLAVTYRGATDRARATAIWCHTSDVTFRNEGNTLSPFADGDRILKSFDQEGHNLGIRMQPRIANYMEIGFKLSPPGISLMPGLRFDVTRQKECKGWVTVGANRQAYLYTSLPGQDPSHNFPQIRPEYDEKPNDDRNDHDEDNVPLGFVLVPPIITVVPFDRVYAIDGTGVRPGGLDPTWTRLQLQWNFVEFVRVKIDGPPFSANANGIAEGSRASGSIGWYSRLDISKNAQGFWERSGPAEQNVIARGQPELSAVPPA